MSDVPARRAVEWGAVLELATLVQRHWGRLSQGERDHVAALLRKSHGRPRNLSKAEWRDIRRILAKLDVAGFGREVGPIARRLRGPQAR